MSARDAVRVVITLPGGYAGLDGRALTRFADALEIRLAEDFDTWDDVRSVEVSVNRALRAPGYGIRVFAPFADDDSGDRHADVTTAVERASDAVWDAGDWHREDVTP